MKHNGIEVIGGVSLAGHPNAERMNFRELDFRLRAFLRDRNIRTDGQLAMEKMQRGRKRK